MSNIKKAHERKFHYVYKTTNTINNKYYIGLRSSEKLNDGYLGSGVLLKRAIQKYGKEFFVKEILVVFGSREEASLYEQKIITKEMVQDAECYNLCVGGDNSGAGKRTNSEESKYQNRIKHLGKKHAESTKELCRQIMVEEHLNRKKDSEIYKKIKAVRNTKESKAKTSAQAKAQWSNKDFRERVTRNMKTAANTEEFKTKSSYNAHYRHHVLDKKQNDKCRWCNGEKKWW